MKNHKVMQKLRERYIESIPNKMDVFEQAITEFKAEQSEEALGTLRRLAHRIRGSAGGYGFPALGEKAGELEHTEVEQIVEATQAFIQELHCLYEQHHPCEFRVLLIEDDLDAVELVRAILEGKPVKIDHVMTQTEAFQALKEQRYQLILLDLVLPDCDGRTILSALREQMEYAAIPVIVLSAWKTNSLVRNECSIYGIEAFIEKPVPEDTFPTLVMSALTRGQDMRQMNEDPLTGLNNRQGFFQSFEPALSLCRRERRPMSLAFFDIDLFKSLNDTFGHDAGDEALVHIANLLEQRLRGSDMIARWGGEEFLLALPGTDRFGAKSLIEAIQKQLRESSQEHCVRMVTFSCGIVEIEPWEAFDVALLRADKLLYAAKKAGRDQCLLETDVAQKKRLRILLVEDDELVTEQLLGMLTPEYDVRYVSSGEEALACVFNEPLYDLVILDQKMEGMSGLEVLKKIKLQTTYCSVPVVFLTVVGERSAIEEAFRLGAADYMLKPYNEALLSVKIKRFVMKR